MRPGLGIAPTLEMGTMRASANFQDPIVRLVGDGDAAPTVTIEEGGVTVELEFPALDAVRRFQRRVGVLPTSETETDR